MFAEHQFSLGHADCFRRNDLIRERVLDDAVLMDARFVRESIRADDGFVRRDTRPCNFCKQPAGWINFAQLDFRAEAEVRVSHGQCDRKLFERSISGAFADAVDRALDLARACANRRERIRDRKAQVVVAMRAQCEAGAIAQMFAHAGEHRRVFRRNAVANRVGQIQDCRACVRGDLDGAAEEIQIASARVFGGKFNFRATVAAITHHGVNGVQRILPRDSEFVTEMEIGGG